MRADMVVHLDTLARGGTVPPEAFAEILADPEAFAFLGKLLKVGHLLGLPDPFPDPASDAVPGLAPPADDTP